MSTSLMSTFVLVIWAALVLLVNQLAIGKKTRLAWTGAAILGPLPILIVFLIVEARNRKRQDGQLRS